MRGNRPSLKLIGIVLTLLFFLASMGKGSPTKAYSDSSHSMAQGEDREADSYVDNDMGNDNESDETGSKFKEDSDDTYEDNSSDQEDSYSSKFKEDQDEDNSDTNGQDEDKDENN